MSGDAHGSFGVDGCPAGWFFVRLEDRDAGFGVVDSLEDLLGAAPAEATILVDVPVGLPGAGSPTRRCDQLCRKMIGIRASSVFPPPARESLAAGAYAEASRINFRLTGKKISRQAWGLAGKIREADAVARKHRADRRRIRESHPELCFFALAGGRPMAHYKKSAAGFDERMAILTGHRPDAAALVDRALARYPRRRVARDDVVDALALAVTACSRLLTLPREPERDECGIEMEMVYPDPTRHLAPGGQSREGVA